ncbi:hypothetical protein DPMN_151973 [Dreissena polymorpha]|uniref:Uncharacterized protein n=1 Tax=Dreissena polymorpha TaxID=45954 RepID=A0A9D4FIP1_DREPO|nr:hypothetical protein DPMN_151973 [Dreissena polymorpha]
MLDAGGNVYVRERQNVAQLCPSDSSACLKCRRPSRLPRSRQKWCRRCAVRSAIAPLSYNGSIMLDAGGNVYVRERRNLAQLCPTDSATCLKCRSDER